MFLCHLVYSLKMICWVCHSFLIVINFFSLWLLGILYAFHACENCTHGSAFFKNHKIMPLFFKRFGVVLPSFLSFFVFRVFEKIVPVLLYPRISTGLTEERPTFTHRNCQKTRHLFRALIFFLYMGFDSLKINAFAKRIICLYFL